MVVCPECGTVDPPEMRQCPQYDSHPVCIDCCRSCVAYRVDPLSTSTCRWYIDHSDKTKPLDEAKAMIRLEKIRRMLEDEAV